MTIAPAYTGTTASIQVDSEVSTRDTSESSSFSDFPYNRASCTTAAAAGIDWVPDEEARHAPQAVRDLCQQCPVRAHCLQWAQATDARGYWAGSSTYERARLTRPSLEELEQVTQDRPVTHIASTAGTRRGYRAGCRCIDCTQANTRHCRAVRRPQPA